MYDTQVYFAVKQEKICKTLKYFCTHYFAIPNHLKSLSKIEDIFPHLHLYLAKYSRVFTFADILCAVTDMSSPFWTQVQILLFRNQYFRKNGYALDEKIKWTNLANIFLVV